MISSKNNQMGNKRAIILQELDKVAKKLKKERFTREEFFKHSTIPVSQNDIEGEFGSYAEAMVAMGVRPLKWKKISDEKLFETYDNVYKKLGHYPLGHPGVIELSKLSPISGHTFRHRFGGLKNFLFEYKNWLLGKNIETRRQTITGKARIIHKLEIPHEESEYFDNKQIYSGKAAENLVVAELLFRGFNAQILQVDEGIDVFATNIKKNELYLIQVKHTYYEKSTKSRPISITVSSFEKNKKSNVYYIFVLEREINRRDFLILPFPIIDQLIRNGSIITGGNSKKISFNVIHNSIDSAFIGNTDLGRYLNAWDVLL